MNPSDPMSREELLELAALDAFGFLDEYEAALFTRSFHHAPAAVQKEIRELQSGFAGDQRVLPLPDVEPEPGLRGRVLQAVARAIETESAELAPLATIGPSRARPRNEAAKMDVGVSGQLWRAAAFVLAGVLLVVLYFGSGQLETNDRIKDMAIDLLAQEQLRDLIKSEKTEDIVGTDLMDFVDNPRCRVLGLGPVAAADNARAIVFVDGASGEAFLLTFGLAAQRPYVITAASEGGGGETALVRSFRPRQSICGVQLGRLTASMIANLSWSIADAGTGVVLLAQS